MLEQILFVAARDGQAAGMFYARQTLKVYRQCARPQRDGKRHFAHVATFRPHFVRSIIEIRRFLRQQ